MPGPLKKVLTPEEFTAWKRKQDLEKQQVTVALNKLQPLFQLFLSTQSVIWHYRPWSSGSSRDKQTSRLEPSSSQASGSALHAALVHIHDTDYLPLPGKELYEQHPEVFDGY